jgi:NAD(P)-dependent dehydrogenase (short-subunit alcohol dehydrogenase family)
MAEQELPLQGKVAVITGASSGIGKAAAISWAALGADLVVSARSDTPRADGYPSLVDTSEGVRAHGRRCVAVRADMAVESDIERLAAETLDTFGRVDIVLNNAAALEPEAMNAGFFDMTPAHWRYQVDVNLTGPWLVMKSLVPSMRQQGGLVINMTSGPLPGDPPMRNLPGGGYPGAAYPTTKAAINRMTVVLAKELQACGVAVVALHPGRVMVERSPVRLRRGGYDVSQWGSIDVPVAALGWLVTHDDPMSFTGTVQYAPVLAEKHALL